MAEVETLGGPIVGARRNGDGQEGLGAIVQQVSPAAVAWDGG